MIASHRPYLTSDGPLAFAHRGGSLERPENTMASFTAAVELGYLHLETDTQLTRDGVLLAFHDETLDRVTDLHGQVSDHTLAEVRRADAGYSFSLDGGRTHPFRGTGVTVPDPGGGAARLPVHPVQHRRQAGAGGGPAGRPDRPAGGRRPDLHRLLLGTPGCAASGG